MYNVPYPKYTTTILRVALILLLISTASWLTYLGWHGLQLANLASQALTLTQGDLEEIPLGEAA